MANHATCVYKLNSFTGLENGFASAAVDPAMLELTQVTVGSDVTTFAAGTWTRTIRLDFTADFKVLWPDTSDQRAPFYNFMSAILEKAAGSPVVALDPVLS